MEDKKYGFTKEELEKYTKILEEGPSIKPVQLDGSDIDDQFEKLKSILENKGIQKPLYTEVDDEIPKDFKLASVATVGSSGDQKYFKFYEEMSKTIKATEKEESTPSSDPSEMGED